MSTAKISVKQIYGIYKTDNLFRNNETADSYTVNMWDGTRSEISHVLVHDTAGMHVDC